MTGRSAPGYHLYRFPLPGPCLLYVASFDVTIPRECLATTTIDPSDLDGFRIRGDRPVKDLLPSSLTLLNPIDNRRFYFETER